MIELVVHGTPVPQGSKRFVGLSRTGKGIMAEDNKRTRPWRALIVDEVQRRFGGAPPALDGPLVVRAVFTMPKPGSAPKRRRTWPQTKPDLSKLLRAVEDALTDAGVWKDDARVVEYARAAKVYPGEDPEALPVPGLRLTVCRMDPPA